ncbi:MAG: DsbA family protein, partial [Rhodospirillaceae bacterium]
ADLAAMAAQIGLDGERFAADLSNAALQARVAQDLKDAATLKIAAVPSFVINGRTVAGRKTLGELTDLVAEALAAPPPRRHR